MNDMSRVTIEVPTRRLPELYRTVAELCESETRAGTGRPLLPVEEDIERLPHVPLDVGAAAAHQKVLIKKGMDLGNEAVTNSLGQATSSQGRSLKEIQHAIATCKAELQALEPCRRAIAERECDLEALKAERQEWYDLYFAVVAAASGDGPKDENV